MNFHLEIHEFHCIVQHCIKISELCSMSVVLTVILYEPVNAPVTHGLEEINILYFWTRELPQTDLSDIWLRLARR